MEFDSPGDVGHTWLVVPAPGEIAGLFRLAGGGPAGAVPDGELWFEDLHQEVGQGQVKLVRGSRRDGAGRGGEGMGEADPAGRMPAASTPWLRRLELAPL